VIEAAKSILTSSGKVKDLPLVGDSIKQNRPICSIIIPCFNYGKYLGDAVESALNQTLPDVEIIIVDDGSSDGETRDIVFSYAGAPRVKVIFQPNAGLSEARNTGIRAAEGTYICCLDADDILAGSYVEQCIYELESRKNAGFAYSWVRLFGDENYVWETRNFSIDEALLDNWTSVSAVYRKADWQLAGGYDARMSGGYEDWEFWLRLAQLGRSGRVIEVPLFYHRRHGETMTHTALELREKLTKRMRDFNSRLFHDDAWLNMVRYYSDPNVDAVYPIDHAANVKKRLDPSGDAILCILPWLQPGGAEILMLDVLSGLAKSHDVIVVTTLNDEHLLKRKYEHITKQIFHFPESGCNDEFVYFIRYLWETRNVKVAITSGSQRVYDTISSIKECCGNLAVVDILHNDSNLGYVKTAVSRTDYIDKHVCVSQKIRSAIVGSGICEDKAVTIANGVDIDAQFSPGRKDRVSGRKKFGLPLDEIVIGFVGRASEEKRPLLYLDLLNRLRQRVGVRGICVTEGPLFKDIVSFIEEHGLSDIVTVVREVERESIAEIYEICDLMVNVSSVEGMPLTVLEALATGCPVAAMAVGELDQVVIDGENGILVPYDDFETLVERCAEFISAPDRIRQIRKKVRRSVIDRGYDKSAMISKYRELIDELM